MLGSKQKDMKEVILTPGETVNHPAHYNQGIEVIDFVESHNMNFSEANVVKYVTRHRYKNGLEDLKKARWYLQREIDKYEKAKRSTR